MRHYFPPSPVLIRLAQVFAGLSVSVDEIISFEVYEMCVPVFHVAPKHWQLNKHRIQDEHFRLASRTKHHLSIHINLVLRFGLALAHVHIGQSVISCCSLPLWAFKHGQRRLLAPIRKTGVSPPCSCLLTRSASTFSWPGAELTCTWYRNHRQTGGTGFAVFAMNVQTNLPPGLDHARWQKRRRVTAAV